MTKASMINGVGKGMFIYYPAPVFQEEGGMAKTILWLKRLGVQHVWIRVIGKGGWSRTQTKALCREFTEALSTAGISWGFWGFMYDPDDNPTQYAWHVVRVMREFSNADLFVLNSEFDHEDDSAIVEERHAREFFKVLCGELPLDIISLFLSSYWKLKGHPRFPIDVYAEFVDGIAHQTYHVHKDPIKTIAQSIELNSVYGLPQIVTAQAFWGEMGITNASARDDFDTICRKWNSELGPLCLEKNVIGFNLWHAGGVGCSAMDEAMEADFENFHPILATLEDLPDRPDVVVPPPPPPGNEVVPFMYDERGGLRQHPTTKAFQMLLNKMWEHLGKRNLLKEDGWLGTNTSERFHEITGLWLVGDPDPLHQNNGDAEMYQAAWRNICLGNEDLQAAMSKFTEVERTLKSA